MTRFLMWPVWWLATLAAIATAATWGALPDDDLASAGGYASGAIVLILAATAMEAFHGPGIARRLAVGAAAIYTFLALRAVLILHHGSPNASETWDALSTGVRGVAMTPWSWLFVTVGIWGWVRLRRAERAQAQTFEPQAATS